MTKTDDNVYIYSTPTCHFCDKVKEFFKANNVEYTDYDVSTNAKRRSEMIDKSGQMGVPVIIRGDDMVIGFDTEKLENLFESKPVPRKEREDKVSQAVKEYVDRCIMKAIKEMKK